MVSATRQHPYGARKPSSPRMIYSAGTIALDQLFRKFSIAINNASRAGLDEIGAGW